MEPHMYPPVGGELSKLRHDLAPDTLKAFHAFSHQVFSDGALEMRIKHVIAVAVAHATQCPYCIRGHTEAALRAGATDQQLMEAIWVAAEIRAGGAYTHSLIAMDEIKKAAHKEVKDQT